MKSVSGAEWGFGSTPWMEGMKEIFFRSELHVLLSCYISQYSNSTFPLEHTTAGEKKKPVPERREEFGKIKVAPACFLLVSCGLLAGLKQPCFTGGFEIRGQACTFERKTFSENSVCQYSGIDRGRS